MGELKKLTPDAEERAKVLLETVEAVVQAWRKAPKAERENAMSAVLREAKKRYPGPGDDLEWGVLHELGRRGL